MLINAKKLREGKRRDFSVAVLVKFWTFPIILSKVLAKLLAIFCLLPELFTCPKNYITILRSPILSFLLKFWHYKCRNFEYCDKLSERLNLWGRKFAKLSLIYWRNLQCRNTRKSTLRPKQETRARLKTFNNNDEGKTLHTFVKIYTDTHHYNGTRNLSDCICQS